MEEPGSQLDLSSDAPLRADGDASRGRFLGVRFECCGVYARIYPNTSGDAYQGRCPRCLRPLRVGVGPEGTSGRFFTAS